MHRVLNPIERPKSRGFSLIEISIVLGIVGVVIGGIWWSAAKVSENRQLNDAITVMGSVMDGVSTRLNEKNTGTMTSANASAVAQLFFPPDYQAGNGGVIYSRNNKLAWRLTLNDTPGTAYLSFIYDPDMSLASPTSRSPMPVGFCNQFLHAYVNAYFNWMVPGLTGTFGLTQVTGATSFTMSSISNLYADWNSTGSAGLQLACSRGVKTILGTSLAIQ